MRKSKFTESQIMAILGEGEAGLPVAEVCRKHGISNATYYQWEEQVRWHVSQRTQARQGSGSREQPFQEDVCGSGFGERRNQGCLVAKVVTPTAKRMAVEYMVAEHRISRSKACRIVGFSRSALYKPTVDWAAKDAPVIAVLNDIVSKRSRWGFWKCFHRLGAGLHA